MFTGLYRRVLRRRSSPVVRAAVFASTTLLGASFAKAQQVSPPAILQDFESTWQTITNRTPDIFAAGYGNVYTPPPGRAQSGNQSVGYDVFDRYDFGSASNPTLYGTGFGLKGMINSIHAMGVLPQSIWSGIKAVLLTPAPPRPEVVPPVLQMRVGTLVLP